MSQKRTVGILVISYKVRPEDRHQIRWVDQDDFDRLGVALSDCAKQDKTLAAIKAEIARLRAEGVTDAQMASVGVDPTRLRRLSTKSPWPIVSYTIEIAGGDQYAKFRRVHQLQLSDIAKVTLARPQVVRH